MAESMATKAWQEAEMQYWGRLLLIRTKKFYISRYPLFPIRNTRELKVQYWSNYKPFCFTYSNLNKNVERKLYD